MPSIPAPSPRDGGAGLFLFVVIARITRAHWSRLARRYRSACRAASTAPTRAQVPADTKGACPKTARSVDPDLPLERRVCLRSLRRPEIRWHLETRLIAAASSAAALSALSWFACVERARCDFCQDRSCLGQHHSFEHLFGRQVFWASIGGTRSCLDGQISISSISFAHHAVCGHGRAAHGLMLLLRSRVNRAAHCS